MEIKHEQFGVRLVPRGSNDNHVCIQLLGEDDEHWFEIGNSFSSYWLVDLIAVLQDTRALLDSRQFTKDRWGYEFRED